MLIDLLFPNRCLQCNNIISGDELVCAICISQVRFTHDQYGDKNLLKERCNLLFPVENAFALMHFEEKSLSQKIIHQLKYGNREKVGKILANWTSERIELDTQKPDVLVSVPLHPKKLRKRGYNQLHLFTETLSKKLDIPFNHHYLKRNFSQKEQARKDKVHRSETENLFSATQNIENQHFLIIDDVFTTGNTMSSIAWEILKSGNNKVSILVMAIDQ